MATLNYAFKELSCKIVYYGCGLCGKTTNLIHIHKTVPGKFRGELVSLATEQDRTLFFDFLPLDLGEVKGFKTKFQLYTVPGQVYYNATRKLVLRGVDGLVFVADSQKDRLQENIDSLENLKQNLTEYGYRLSNGPEDNEGIPWVLQLNKRDLPAVATLDELNAALNSNRAPVCEAVAFNGTGVKDTLKLISSLVIKKLNSDTTSSGIGSEKAPKPLASSGSSKGTPAAAKPPAPKDDEYGELSEEEIAAEEESVAKGTPVKAVGTPSAAAKAPEPKPAAPAPASSKSGGATPAKPAAAAQAAPPPKGNAKASLAAELASGPPTLNVVKQCSAAIRGIYLGRGALTLANAAGERDMYSLTGSIKFLGIFGGAWNRKLKFQGTESKNYEGAQGNFFKFIAADNVGPALEVFVKDDFDKTLFVTYLGTLGEVKIVTAGKKPLG